MTRYGDLVDQTGMSGPRPFLYCSSCFEEYSANAGDYSWYHHDDDECICMCGEVLNLVTRRIVLEEVKS